MLNFLKRRKIFMMK